MKKINNKGFTLIEVLAVVVIIAIIGLIALPSIISTINTGKNASYDITVKNITTASIGLHEEISYTATELYHYDNNGKTETKISVTNNKIETNLQTLVSNGFLTGINNPNRNINNNNYKIITNPKTNEDIGECKIIIIKTVDSNFNTSYKIEDNSNISKCPTTTEYKKALNIQEGD